MRVSELVERVEKATGPDGELDREIHEALFGANVMNFGAAAWVNYTGSIDAAMTLVPEGEVWRVEDSPLCGPCAMVGNDADTITLAATPALALVAAALRAREGDGAR